MRLKEFYSNVKDNNEEVVVFIITIYIYYTKVKNAWINQVFFIISLLR